MRYVLVKYTVRPEKVGAVKAAIREFGAEIAKREPKTLLLAFRADDGQSFYHLMRFENEAAQRRHNQSKHNAQFVKKVYPNCTGKPQVAELRVVEATKKQWRVP
ncbi:MAG: antibiotic biosynthesis monooxygenase [Verrucomicrobiales bacterium]|nr:antibiotic biosynthesis monooxygenase [Verrucomicrobiales bacterium]